MFENILLFLPLFVGVISIIGFAYFVGDLFKPEMNFVHKTLYGLGTIILITGSFYCVIFTIKFTFALGVYYGY